MTFDPTPTDRSADSMATDEVTSGDLASEDFTADEVAIDTEANGRQRRIAARLPIACPPELLWQVLTAYEQLPEFLPNLVASRRLEHPEGGIRLEQIGAQQLLKVNFRARVVLDLEEVYPERIQFQMVEGDFRQFHGYWALECAESTAAQTQLTYCVTVLPPRVMPARLIEQRLRQDLSANLLAIRQRVCGSPPEEQPSQTA